MVNRSEFVQKKIVYNIDISKIKELCLKGEVPELSGLAIPLCNEEERKILSKNNEVARMVNERLEELLNDEKFITFMEAQEEADEKRFEVLEKWANDTAKNMLSKGIEVCKIANYTGLDEDEIEALK